MKSVCSMFVLAMLAVFLVGCSDLPEAEKMPVSKPNPNVPDETRTEAATFAAGCFWGVEAAFRKVDGVTVTEVGYTGGHAANPTYREVCSGRTGQAEAVRVEFDPSRVSYEALLDVFWNCHDPTTLNRQGPDVGSQYRSAIFFHTPVQQTAAEDSAARLEQSGHLARPIVTEIAPAGEFYRAEEYHQRYLEKGGRSSCGPAAR